MDSQIEHFEDLSHPWRGLILLMQEMNFGRFENLPFKHGQPDMEDPDFKTVTEFKFGGKNGPREEAMLTQYHLKKPIVELIDTLESIGDGMIRTLVVKNGLPFLLELEDL